MKRIKTIFAALMMFAGITAATSAAHASPVPDMTEKVSSLVSLIPNSIVIEQTSTFGDGRTITVYYKKDGNTCEVYTDANLMRYDIGDIVRIQNSNFRVVEDVKGKRVYRTTTAKAAKLLKDIIVQCL